MATKKSHAARAVLAFICAAFVGFGCSPGDPVQPETAQPANTAEPAGDQETTADGAQDETADTQDVTPTATVPTLADDDVISVVELGAGAQVEDIQGNLLVVYGVAEWPETFELLPDETQQTFPFFGDVSALSNPAMELVALDIGICAAGIDAVGFGTAEFFVHDTADSALSTDPVLDRGVLARHPVVQPSFAFPTTAECLRGWLPVLWSGAEAPTTARYLLTTRASASAEIERHVYQWDLDEPVVVEPVENPAAGTALFSVGQTVTFNQGRLADTTVVVDGWAEFVGNESELEGTRIVGVSLTACPADGEVLEFGLGVNQWNLTSPLPMVDAPVDGCFDGWIEFVVPFGGVPTSFFVSDGVNPISGYAEWSLAGAALPAPS